MNRRSVEVAVTGHPGVAASRTQTDEKWLILERPGSRSELQYGGRGAPRLGDGDGKFLPHCPLPSCLEATADRGLLVVLEERVETARVVNCGAGFIA